jgi:hypothetical protein
MQAPVRRKLSAVRTERTAHPTPSGRVSAFQRYFEPVSGFEPLTVRLQEACCKASSPLPAPMPHESAAAAPKTQGFPGDPFHDPFHAAELRAVNRTPVPLTVPSAARSRTVSLEICTVRRRMLPNLWRGGDRKQHFKVQRRAWLWIKCADNDDGQRNHNNCDQIGGDGGRDGNNYDFRSSGVRLT